MEDKHNIKKTEGDPSCYFVNVFTGRPLPPNGRIDWQQYLMKLDLVVMIKNNVVTFAHTTLP